MDFVGFECDADAGAYDVADGFEDVEGERVGHCEFFGDATALLAGAVRGEVDWVEGCVGF